MARTPVILTTSEVATRYRVHPATIRRWVVDGLLKPTATTPGGHYRFTEADVEAFFARAAAERPAS